MGSEPNTSFDSNHGSTSDGKQDGRKQQFTTKQRIDMYAFCVLELELHGNTVSIKKQQLAIQKALKKEQALIGKSATDSFTSVLPLESNGNGVVLTNHLNQDDQRQATGTDKNGQAHPTDTTDLLANASTVNGSNGQAGPSSSFQQEHQQMNPPLTTPSALQPVAQTLDRASVGEPQLDKALEANTHETASHSTTPVKGDATEHKTLLELQRDIAKTQRSYSDHQKTRVLTSSMLREVQKRFSRYYPDTPCPSRTTIKHVFMKCVETGTVENVKNPRKPTKIPNGEQIEQFLIEEPQMSLREMAKKLNVSTGTVSRRCKALGIVPESVTLKHQQMAMAKRQKQMKHVTAKAKTSSRRTSGSSRQKQQATMNYHEQSHYTNGTV